MKNLTVFPQPSNYSGTTLENVMIIDDDNICHLIMTRNIELAGFAKRSLGFTSAIKALDELLNCYTGASAFPDVIFLDINMPQMNGWEFLKEFDKLPRQFLNHTKIIMLSSSNASRDIEQAKTNKHIYDYIEKPISTEKLELLLQKIMADKPVVPSPTLPFKKRIRTVQLSFFPYLLVA